MMMNLRAFSTLFFVLVIQILFSQTTIINPAAEGGFELGPTFGDNGWTASSGTNNPWVVGTAVSSAPIAGNSAYVSNTAGATNAYDITTPCVNYFYRDVTVPAGEISILLSFNWIAQGESTWDLWQVFVAPTSITPVGVNTHPGSGASNVPAGITGATFVGSGNLQGTVQTANLYLPSNLAGTTFRLIFSWKSDTSGGTQPPASIDNISLVSSLPSHKISATSGDWTSGSTWVGGIPPTSADTATVSVGHTVNINSNNLSSGRLNVSGTLAYSAAATTFIVPENLKINTGGIFNVFNSTTGKTLIVGGNLTNDGTLDISVGTTSAGNLTLNGTTVQTVSGSGTFTGNLIRNLTLNNTNNATPNIVWNVNNIAIAYNIAFTSGRMSLMGNKLSWYNSTNTAAGSLTVNSGQGILPGGKFARYWTTAQTGTAVTAGTDPSSNTSRYPFINSSGQNRSIWISRSSSSTSGNTAGELGVTYTDASSFTTGLSVSDGAYTITDRYNANWAITAEGGYVYASGTHILVTVASQAFFTPGTNSRLMNASTVAGTFQTGSTTPSAQRTGLTTAQITAEPFYMGINGSEISNMTTTSGDWNNAAIWSKGTVPTCTEGAVIVAGHTVNSTSADVCKSVTILGNLITGSGGNLLVGCTDNNASFTIDGGMYEIQSGGSLTVNGKFALSANTAGIFKQSGGTITVDGNSGVLATSTPSHVADMYCHNASTLQLTGGVFNVIDPPLSTTSTNCAFKVFPASTSGFTSGSGIGWTLKLGDGVSTNPGGHTGGYLINLANTNSFSLNGTVIVDVLAGGTNRHVSSSNNVPIENLNIMSGEYRISSTTYIKGNIVNNGTLTSTSTLNLSDFAAAAAVTGSKPQTISGSGTFRNSTTSTTASVSSLTINNSAGVTLNTPISVSGTLTLTNGLVNTTSTNILRLGSTTSNGTLSGTPDATKHINGPFARTFATSQTATNTFTSTHLFPVGVGGVYQPVWVSPSTTSAGVTFFSAETYGAPNPGTAAPGVSNLSDATWIVTPNTTANLTNVHVQLGENNIVTGKQILQASTASGMYGGTSSGSSAGTSTTPPSIKTNSPIPLAEFTGFFAHGDLIPCTAPIDQPSTFVASQVGSTSLIGSFTPAASNPTGYIAVRYASPGTYTAPSNNTIYTVGSSLGTGTIVSFGPALSFSQTGLTAGITYDYVIYSYNNTACFGPTYNTTSPLVGMVTTCSTSPGTPGTPVSSGITNSSFTATWTASSTPGVDYYIDVSTNSSFSSFVSGYDNLNLGTVLTTNITGLTSNTTYYLRVKAVSAGCYSTNSSSLSVKTECDPFTTFPVTEPFNTYLTNTCWNEGDNGSLATGPATYSQTASDAWVEDGFLNSGSTGSAKVNVYFTGKNDWLISPLFTIPAAHQLKYSVGATQFASTSAPTTPWESDDFVELLVSTDLITWTVLKTYNDTNVPSHLGQIDVTDLSAYSGQTVKFAFRAVEGATNGSADIDFFIDNVTVEPIPVPSITSLGSMSGCPGGQLIINGTNLLGATAPNITIGGTPVSSVVSNTGTVLTVVLPLTTASGIVSVTIGANTANSSGSFTINPKPTAILSPAGPTSICQGQTQTFTTTTDIGNTFVWKRNGSIISGANTATYDATLEGAYKTIVSVSGTGCSDSTSSSTLIVNLLPTTVGITTSSTELCNGSISNLTATGGNASSIYTGSRLMLNKLIPDNELDTLKDTLILAGLPLVATLDSIIVTLNITHTWDSDLDIYLQAPNGNIMELSTANGGSGDNYTNTRITTVSTASDITLATAPFTGTFRAEGYLNLGSLQSQLNGNWKLIAFDAVNPDQGTLLNWSLKIVATSQATLLWSPSTGLYTDMAATIPYAGENTANVYAKPNTTTTYTVTATSTSGCTNTASTEVGVTGDEVMNENNSGTGSLRKAIECTAAGDTVFISSGSVNLINMLTQLNVDKPLLIMDDNGSPVMLKFDFSTGALMTETNGGLRVGTMGNVTLDNIHVKHVANDATHPVIKNEGILTLKNSKVTGETGNMVPPVVQNATGATINAEGSSEIKYE